jgi:hypothetical protein
MSAGLAVLAIIGLLVGLLVLGVVIYLLNDILRPLLSVNADLQDAVTAPMLEKGIPGADQLSTTRRLADSVPPLAIAYLNKLALPQTPAPPTPSASAPVPAARPAAAGAGAGPSQQGLDAPSTMPPWKGFSQ